MDNKDEPLGCVMGLLTAVPVSLVLWLIIIAIIAVITHIGVIVAIVKALV